MEQVALNKLSIAERERLLKLARAKLVSNFASTSPIPRADRSVAMPLSWAQQRLWFLDQLDRAAGAAYHIPTALRLSGALNRTALQASLDRIVARHESLRTTFVSVEGEPQQVIEPPDIGFVLIEYDLGDLDEASQAAAVAEHSDEEARTPFDLARGPLLRGRLLQLAEHEHVVLVTLHHIVSDGWSTGVLVREVSALYTAFCQGAADPLPALPIQYADYAAWQRQWLQGDALRGQLDFWCRCLKGAPALLELPTDRPRPPMQSYRGNNASIRLSHDLSARLRALSQRHGVTLFMTMLAGWSALLSRLSGQDDIVVGSPVANRQRAEIEPLIGLFVNTLALRVDLSADPSVAALLAQVKATTLDAYMHQDLPFEQVVEALQPERSLAHSPVFQVLLVLNNTPGGDGLDRLPGLTLSGVDTLQQTAQVDLALYVSDLQDGIVGGVTYATDLFDHGTVERMLGHWVTLLEGMVADETQSVSRLPLLTGDERERVLAGFNATHAAYPPDLSVHALFEAQVARTPEAIALQFDGQSLSYAILNRRANQLAHRLIALGVQPDDRVAICVERSLEMVVGLLGILKAGGAYVPLDPSYPDDRLAYMLEDSAPSVVLTQAALLARLPMLGSATTLVLDAERALAALPEHDPVVAGLTPWHLAYVIYTSGSTGQPKGAMNEHRGVVNRLLWAQSQFQLSAEDRVVQKTPFGFDVSVWEFFLPLLAGARLVLAKPAGHQDPEYLVDLIEEAGITVAHFVPSMLQLFLERAEAARCGSVRDVLCSGEALPPALQLRCQRALPHVRLHNLYGPTEAAVDVTYWRCDANRHPGIVPIGRPIANTRMYVLDKHGVPVPVGVTGELHIGGVQVGRGYWQRPQLTAERFLPDPFSGDADARMYKTGDLGRWLPDGSLEYLGRNDFQVKLRGFRIELGEIEATLASCVGVRDAVVIAREDGGGDTRLVAYFVLQDEAEVTASALRERLLLDLPEYMIPSAFVRLDALPLTPNGKLDRRALPAPDQDAVASRLYAAPVGQIEQAIATIWQNLLGLAQVGRHDHFFELGGHSLLAVRLATRLRAALGVEVALRDVFAQPTLAGLAHALSGATASSQDAIVPVERDRALPLSWAQQRLWFLDQLDHAAGAAYHIPAALRLRGALDRDALRASLDRIVARHESLRTTFVSVEGEPQQVIAPAEVGFVLVEHDLRDLDEAAQAAAVAEHSDEEARAPFDLSIGPLIRGRLLRLSDQEHVLLVTQHHIVSDGWSIGVLVREVAALYTAFCQGAADPLPPLPIQYADYAAWQRQWLQGEVLQAQLAFWRKHLLGAPALLELPTDRPRPAVQRYAGDALDVRLPPALTTALRGLSQRHGVTLFMTLLAGWSALLSRLSGQDDIVVGSPVANRQRAEIEPLIGFFVNTLALRVDLAADPSVAALLAQVKATTLGAYAHQDLPFEQVVEALQPERSLAHSPVFQVLLTLNNTPAGDLEQLSGLRLSGIASERHTAQFDLSLSLTETPERVAGSLGYATDLFDRGTVERLLGHWVTLLEGMVADETQPVSRLPLLTGDERERVLAGFGASPIVNAGHIDYPQDRSVHALFEAQVMRTPEAIALQFDDQSLSYAALNRRANQVAHHLIALGVQPDDHVAICVERSLEMVVGLLGILKAGGGYVPLDPIYPAERLAYMLEDSAPVALLTQAALQDRLPASSVAIPTLVLDAEASLAAMPEHDPVVPALTTRSLAYVIYTSGSTGQPKGVMVEHGHVVRLFATTQAQFRFDESDVWTLFHSFAFDFSVWEIWGALFYGGRLVIVPALCARTPSEFYALLVREGVTVLNQTPSAFRALMAAQQEATAEHHLRVVVFGGEALELPMLAPWFARNAAARTQLINMYGITEITVHATYRPITEDDVRQARGSLIGRALPDLRLYVLDRHRQPVPIGVMGELHVAGGGVARGYWQRPQLTAERFLPDPFSGDADARMYKTGDLGRWLPDGSLEYLGRNDFQVKLRGFRIELGEIEATLAGCVGVRDAVVLAREDGGGDTRLVAYFVLQDEAEVTASALRERLLLDLPEYMIPSAFVHLDALPLTPNGKLDRRALPAPDQDAVASRLYAAPVGQIEQAIATIWQDLLGLAQVGRHDHFFELGGHSLLAVRLATRLRAALGVEVALRDVFAQPTLAGLAHALSGATASSQAAIVPVERDRALPLSWAQQRLWFLDQLDHAAGAAYHIPAALRLRGALDRAALRASLDRIVARHESLRTTFVSVEGEPQQVIAPAEVGFVLVEHDLRDLDEAAQAAAVAEHSDEEARAPFDLSVGPLIRGRLLRLSDQEHVLLVTQHHIVSDGWSTGVLVREVAALYTAFCQGAADPLPPLPIHYADYAAWQRQWLQGEVLQAQLAFWRTHLLGAPALLELPTDRPRPAVQRYAGDALDVRLPPALTTALRGLSQRHGVTLFMTLLAGWSALLSRLSGQDDIVVGSPVANRQRAEIEPLIGFFVNTLALRVDLAADPSVAALLAQVKATTLGAYAHQDLPFEQVVEALQPERSLAHSPVFQVLLTLNNTPAGDLEQLSGLRLSGIASERHTAQFDLSLSLTETPERVAGSLGYATDLFDRGTVERLLGHWVTLLEGMVADETQPVSRLPLLTGDERERVLAGFNATHAAYPPDLSVHALFEAQVARTPEAIALQFDGQSLSYAILNRRANQLAHRLIALGVQPDDRVAICVERSLEMVVGLLGILKAGGAYVPLDPSYPDDRLAYMLEDSAPSVVLTQAALLARLPMLGSATTLVLDAERALAALPEHDPVVAGLTPWHLAYVIYTSGSTGQPKGAMNEHRGVVNRLLWAQSQFQLSAEDRVVQKTPFGFDVSVWEFFLPLLAGARLVLAKPAGHQDPEYLVDLIEEAGITLAHFVPSMLQLFLERAEAARCGSVRDVLCSGEALPPALQLRCQRALPHVRLHNLYGPTEAAVDVTYWRCDADRHPGIVPIGRPIANTRMYVLDKHGVPVPVGVTGELHIGGVQVGRGYWQRPQLTAERFLPDPFSGDADARMYKTGDLGRWLPDGSLEYLGRNDFQVKLRGFRIELGEIEATLAGCAGVRDAVVIAREDGAGDTRLVAYVVLHDGETTPSIAELRERLSQDLPEYMIPSAFVRLDALPLTPNGKLDRQALPAPDQDAVASRLYAAPVGQIEQAIATIWQNLLGLAQVGRHDHFFELGGHSLLAVRLATRLRAALGVEVALRDVFAQPTLAGLAHALSGATASSQDAIVPVERDRALPLSWAQQRLWFLDQLDHAAGAAYHIPAALRLRGALDRDALRASLDRIVARHESLRTTFVSVEGEPQQVIAPAEVGFVLVEHDLRDLDEAAQAAAVAEHSDEEARAPFDLSIGPLIRGRLLRLSDQEHVLLVTQHHIVSDGWSIGVLVREVAALYTAFCQGAADPLPPLPIQYADYAAWQRQWLQGEVLQAQLAFWRKHLLGAPALLELPTDRPRPAVQRYAGDALDVRLPPALTTALRGLSQRHGVTLFMTLLAGWSALLSRLSGQDDIVVGSPVANRQRAEIEPLIGFFVNTLALRVDLAADPSVAALLAQVKATTLGAYAHQDLPFEQVVEALQPERSLAHSPVFQVLLTLNNTPAGDLEQLSGLRLSGIASERHTAQFDLSLSLTETPERVAGSLGYATDLFDRGTVERLLGHWVTLLEGMVADETQPVSRLPLLTGDERERVLAGFGASPIVNAGHIDYPQDRSVHALFEAQVMRTPEAIALQFDDQSLSYAALNRRANQVAHHLIALGVQPDDHVAICVERSLEMVVGLLGILKAGGGYVPLDPIYPAERLAYMLEDSAPVALLTQAALQDRLPASSVAIPTLVLDAEASLAAMPEHDPVVPALTTRSLAYVIYTSGSTGQPKGVMVEHGHVVRLFATTQAQFRFDESDVWTLFHSFAFDFSVWEIWGALFYGGRLVIVPALCARTPSEFYALLVREGVTVLNQTPSAFRALMAAQQEATAEHHLRVVVFGGEALELPMLAPWFARNAAARTQLINMYGITEITVHATYRPITEDDVRQARGSLIGRALPDLRLYVLDRHRQPVPIGVMGELHVAGGGVARGYWQRPQLTAERFLPDPFSGDADARMYKTGDLGRWLPDGSLEYLGRNDFQVKLRGFRIELGEIEATLAGCVGVRDAVVIAREDGAGDTRLVAYVVLHDDETTPSIAELRERLSQDLPEYMIPSAFVRLDALPLTPNGKLDRQALPAPDQDAVASRLYAAPVGQIEQAIATIWQDLLGLAQVGRHDHFFELGGHSLLIIGLIERLRQHGLRADVRMVFMTPILCALAEQLAGDPQTTQRMDIAPNQITTETASIVPELLPLVRLSQEQIDGIVAGVPGGVSNVQDIYPLAPLQEGILFHHLLGGEGDAYLVRTVATFDGRERLDDFLGALQAVIDRHDILRSSMHWEGLPRPVQVVQRRAPLKIVEVALAAGIAAAPQLLARTDPRRIRLDLRYAPLLTAYTAADPASGEWMLALLSHHIIDDNYSMQILLKEMRWLMQGRGDLLAAPLPYRNFIASAHTVPDAAHEAYFRKRLGDVEEPTAPYGVLNVQGDGGSVGEAQVQLDEALSQRIRDAARRQGATPAALFHLAWARVLGQCSGRDDVVFGTVLSGRMQHSFDAESVVGVFINTLPIRIAFEGTGVGEMVRATHRNLSELLTHEQASLALAQRCSAVPLPLPLFTALMNYRHSRGEARRQDDSTGRAWEGIRVVDGEERTNYPLAVSVDDLQQGFRLTVQCAAGIDPATLASYLETVVHGLVEALESEPQRPLRQLPLMPAAARDRVLVEFNATRAEYPQDQLIHEVFEAQAAEHPDAIAVECDGRCLSYGELNRRANQVAHRLIALGVRPDERVAICVERSFDMVIGLLGVLKAGGAYVPLDPNYPAERLAYLLEDSAPVAMLIRSRLEEGTPMPASSGRPVLALEEVASSAQFEHAHDPRIPGLTARNLAYVIYTSGSTGKPKGVMVEHRSVLRLVINSGYAPIAATDCVGHGSNPAFDASVWEIWGALLNGARLLVIPQSVLMDAHALNRLLTGARVTVILLTTGLFNEYAAMLGPAFAELKYLLVGGDVLDARNAARLMSGARPPQHLVNAYGPTETTTIATTFEVETASPAGRSVPIGRPIANTHVYILDEQGEPVPPGVSGELHIGGPGVARGYLNRAELTAQRFLVDPFVNDKEARMYKTGDLGRWLPDGNIEYLGRNDSQVKIRGFRIELGEIEAWLAACPKVRDAVVVAHEHSVGDKRLVAYVVAADDGFSIGELREHLRRDLPDYMIPGAFVRLDALPLTPNGKLDRKALPAPDQLSQGSREYEAPVGDTEVAMAQIFRELLNLPQVGRDDHFFELGGHSLLAIRLIHAIKLRFAVSLPLASIFSSPSVKALAEMVEQDRHSESSLVPLQTSGSQRPLFCFHPVGGHVSVYRALAGCFAGRCPVYGVQSPEVAGSRLRIDSMQDMAMAYATAIRAAQPVGPYRLLGWSTGGLIAAETARYLAENGDTVDYLGLIDVHTNFGDAARSEEQLLRKAALVELRASGVSPGEWAGTEAPPALEAIAGLLEADFSDAAPELLAWGLSGFDRAAFDHLKTQVPITAHHLALVSAFRPDPVDVPVQAFWANESVVMSGPDPHPARIQIGAVETQAIDTDHDGLLRAPHVERVAAAILAFLERSERSPQTAQAAGRIARAPLEANP